MNYTYKKNRVLAKNVNNHYQENRVDNKCETKHEEKEKELRNKEHICKKYNDFSQLPVLLTYKEVASVLGTSRQTTYNYMNMPDFPSFKISDRVIRVYRDDFIKWLENKKHESDIDRGAY